jgi:hypothetical protein
MIPTGTEQSDAVNADLADSRGFFWVFGRCAGHGRMESGWILMLRGRCSAERFAIVILIRLDGFRTHELSHPLPVL